MKPSQPIPAAGTCNRCGECCRWLPIILVWQYKPHQLHYLRERGLKEEGGYFLAHPASTCARRSLTAVEHGSGAVLFTRHGRPHAGTSAEKP
ncbi:MAG: hypothetical protein Q7V05_13735 [Methanoregula sp.]|nr:hypothetical protein [Methanoregula sp.]